MSIYGLVCATTLITLKLAPGAPDWAAEDFTNMRIAETRCEPKYGQRSPCLKQFIKYDVRDYGALCGPKDEYK